MCLPVIAAGLVALNLLPISAVKAQEDAHGGSAETNSSADIHQPGEAVQAPRTMQRYTDEGMTIDPVAFDIDPQGNIYIAEGSRASHAVLDNRKAQLKKTNGVINDLQKTSVQDRLDQINMLIEGGHYKPDHFTNWSDRVRLIKDTTGDGKADTSTIFADHFNDPLDGIASGVLYHDGKVYLTNIPHLWLLEDKDGDGDADKETPGERTSLSYGYGIRWAFYGHDMHGLIKGPDGRIYFSIGDRGYNVKTKEGKHLYGPDRGAVFRMWPDGSGLELFFEGLRNPQELAFDNYGNLFTGDNNSDAGDKARFVYLPEGGDSGWRQDVQSLNDRGPWNREHMWKPRDVEKFGLDQPAWIIPPLANVGRGPSGLAHYPGTGDVFPTNGSFLMCDYPAGVRHVALKPSGATFEVVEDSTFVDGGTITDVAWGYDGRLYLSDWGGGWNPNPNGHIKTMVNEAAHEKQAELIAEVKKLFAEGFEKLSDEKLIELLGHADQRVRLEAQWELASRESVGAGDGLVMEWLGGKSELSRLHALWALGMIERENQGKYRGAILYEYFEQPDAYDHPQLVAQAMSVLGEIGYSAGKIQYLNSLKSEHLIEQYHAAIALGKVGTSEDVASLLDLLDRNNNEDVAIRHAASYGLSLIGDADKIASEMKSRGSAARLGGVLALRRLDSPLLADFLNDEDAMVAAEAARAIYDKRIMDAMPALAKLIDTLPVDRMSEPVMRRVIEANVRLADADSAKRLAKLAANAQAPELWRLLALDELDQWSGERNREGVWGAWWPRPEQSMDAAMAAMMTTLPGIINSATGEVHKQAVVMNQRHVAQAGPDQLAAIALNPQDNAELRFSALQLLIESDRDKAIEVSNQLVDADDAPPQLRIDARLALIQLDLQKGQESYVRALKSGELIEQQDAIDRLSSGARASGEIPGSTLIQLAESLQRGTLAPELRLDVIQAVTSNQALPAQARIAVQRYIEQNQLPGEGPFIRDAVLTGGSVERGKDIFLNQDAAQCQRCHAADGSDTVGPGLNGIGTLHDATYLYNALVLPSLDIAPGFANSTVRLKTGQTLTGRILADQSTDSALVMTNADGVITEVPRDQIDGVPITSDQSLMPAMTDKLTPIELRDVIAYLGSLTGEPNHSHQQGKSNTKTGPSIVSIASGMPHAFWLPVVLLSVIAPLVLLLLLTLLSGGAYHATAD